MTRTSHVTRLRWLVGVAALGLVAAACGGTASEEAAETAAPEPAETEAAETAEPEAAGLTGSLRMLVNITPVLTQEWYEGLVQPFMDANPGVTVTIEAPTGQNVTDSLQQQIAAGNPPDVVSGGLPTEVAELMLELPESESWVSETPFLDYGRNGGRIWRVGSGAQIQSLMFYNKAAFEKAGITECPTTVDQLTADLKALKKAGYVPLQTAGEWVTGYQFLMMANPIAQRNTENWFQKRTAGEVAFADSDYDKYLQVYESWIKDGLVPKDAPAITYEKSISDFTSGKSATYIMGSWLAASADAAEKDFEVGVCSVPTFDGSVAAAAGNPSMPYSILAQSANQEAALALVKFLVSDTDAVTKQLAVEGNFRPGFTYEQSPLNAEVGKVLEAAGTQGVVIGEGYGDNTAPPGWVAESLQKQLESMYLGTSAADVVAELDKWWTANATG